MKTSSIQRAAVVTAAVAAVLSFSYSTMAATVTWTGATSTDFETGTNWTNPTTPNTPPVDGTTTDIGTFSGTVTANQPSLSKSRSILGLAFTTATGGWTLNTGDPAYTLTVGASGIDTTGQTSGTTTINSNLVFIAAQSINSGATGSKLVLNGTGSVTNSVNVTFGGSGEIATYGNYSFNGGQILNAGTTFSINGGTFTTGGSSVGFRNSGTTNINTGATAVMGRLYATYGGNAGIVNVNGGTLSTTLNYFGHGATHGTLNLISGEFDTTATFTHDTVATGGNIVNFNGATYKATGASIGDLTATAGKFSLRVLEGGAIIDTNGNPLAITNNALVHGGVAAVDGGLTKRGAGTLTLGAANTYTGNTTVTRGTLIDNNAVSGVGTGNVIVAPDSALGAVFQMNAATDLTVLQSLTLTDFAGSPNSATANLNYTGTDTILSLINNGTVYGTGVYGATPAPGVTQVSFLTGSGTLTVVPEPALFGVVGLGTAALLRRKRRAMSA